MYRTGDPRFRRRLNEIGQTLESANESAQSNLYIFGQTYIKPCLESLSACCTTCVEASCPSLNLTATQRERHRRQLARKGRPGHAGRAELSFDFYDDWDDDETDALMGWGNEEFDRLLAGSGAGYGTTGSAAANNLVTGQPGRRQKGMTYPKGRRKSAHDTAADPTVIPGSSLFGKLFGGKALRYKPSAADLQEHPGARAQQDLTEGEALLREGVPRRERHRRTRSGTAASAHTTDSLSSRGDIFPSDEEFDDAIPLDDEFAMVLERRGTASAPETESSSGKTRSVQGRRGPGKRPSSGSRTSTLSSRGGRSSGDLQQLALGEEEEEEEEDGEGISEIKTANALDTSLTAAAVPSTDDASRPQPDVPDLGDTSDKEATSTITPPHEAQTPLLEPVIRHDEPSAMTTPLAVTDDENGDAKVKMARNESKI